MSTLKQNDRIWTNSCLQTELLDEFTEVPDEVVVQDASETHKDDIGFGKSDFSWSREELDGTLTPSRQKFKLRIDDEVKFKKGGFNLILGPTGSGKTSVLMALLGEMHYIPSGPDSWVNLPRDGGVAYAAQESWVQNETIKVSLFYMFMVLVAYLYRRKISFLALPTMKSGTNKVRHIHKNRALSLIVVIL